jgi:secondary thiamine-phosphate synthase enzyme
MQIIHLESNQRNTLVNITSDVQKAVKEMDFKEGVVTVYCPHTTAAVTINESADPDVQSDILKRLNIISPDDPSYAHSEGNSDAHIKSSLMGNSVQVFVEKGQLQLGTWQAIYFCEFDGPRKREVWVRL